MEHGLSAWDCDTIFNSIQIPTKWAGAHIMNVPFPNNTINNKLEA